MPELPEVEDEPGYLQKSLEEADEGMELGRHEIHVFRDEPYTEAHQWSVENERGRKWILPQSSTDSWTQNFRVLPFRVPREYIVLCGIATSVVVCPSNHRRVIHSTQNL